MDERELLEWEPFSIYETPCFVLLEGDKAIYDPELSEKLGLPDYPIKLHKGV